MELNGIIFDLDGVLVHTDEFHYQAWKQLADRLCIPFDRQVNNRLRGVSRMASLEIILEAADRSFSDEEKLAMAEEKNAAYRKLLETMSPKDVSDEVVETLSKLKERGIRLAIGSSSKNAGFILKQTGLDIWMDAVSDGNNITRSKPDPQVFLMAADMLTLPPAQCAVVEDATAGIDAALAGGFLAVGIGDAAGYDRTDKPLSTFSDLLSIL
ncbi:MAG: beta-phosphoglucomutase [Clostridiales bacterium]|nr:beta-phosphoglucomutase [Clostridiales bacterium]